MYSRAKTQTIKRFDLLSNVYILLFLLSMIRIYSIISNT